jgi:hypothetical protein
VRPGITDAGMLWEEGHNIGGDGFSCSLAHASVRFLAGVSLVTTWV